MSRNNYDDIIERQIKARKKDGMSRFFIALILLVLLVSAIAAMFFFFSNVKEDVKPDQEAQISSPLVMPDEEVPDTVVLPVITPAPAVQQPQAEEEMTIQATPLAVSLESVSTLRESRMQKVTFTNHTVAEGETTVSIAWSHFINPSTLKSVNGLTREVMSGDVLLIPSVDGTVYSDSEGRKIFIPSEN